jgi:ubiquinone/menaquinone biosynthesis C-methylase UbiE
MKHHWEAENLLGLLSLLVGRNYGDQPDRRLNEIRVDRAFVAKKLYREVSGSPKHVALEIGSGCGFMSRPWSKLVKHLHSCDISQSFLAYARAECAGEKNITFHHLEKSADLSFLKGESIDLAFAHDVFIHFNLFDVYLYLEALARVMREGGMVWFNIAPGEVFTSSLPPLFLQMADYYRHGPLGTEVLMQWNSSQAVLSIAESFGFKRVIKRGSKSDAIHFFVLKKVGKKVKKKSTRKASNRRLR